MLVKKNSLEIEEINVYNLHSEVIKFPIFQRGFSWKEVQTEQILEDLIALVDQPNLKLYLLDFIWFEENGHFKLADGQQRLITMYILIKCINEVILEKKLDVQSIKNFTIFYDDEKNQEKFREFDNGNIVAPFKKVYLHIKNFINDNSENIKTFSNLIKNNIFIFLKKAGSVDDAFEIFKQINTGGKPLSKDEIIKTILNQYQRKYNIKFKHKAKELKTFLNSYYKFKKDEKESNFDSIAIMAFLNESVVGSKTDFQEFAEKMDSVMEVQNNPFFILANYIHRKQIVDILHNMIFNSINPNNPKYKEKVLFPLVLLSISLTIANKNPGGRILKLWNDIITQLKNNSSPETIELTITSFIDSNRDFATISFSQFLSGIGSSNTKLNIKKAIFIIDVMLNNNSGSINLENINLEHVYPKKPDLEWGKQGWPLNDTERKEIINNIGNLFLLNETTNKKIQNKYIDEKVNLYKKALEKDKFLQTSLNSVDFEKFKLKKEKYIKERQFSIANEIYEAFHFAKIIITKGEE